MNQIIFNKGWGEHLFPLHASLRKLLCDRSAHLIIGPGILASEAGHMWLDPRGPCRRLRGANAIHLAEWLGEHGRRIAIDDLWTAPRAGGMPLSPPPMRPEKPQWIASYHGIGVVIGINGCLSLDGPCTLEELPVADIAWLLAHCPHSHGPHPLAGLASP